jgi:hypothetical protein
MRCVEIIFLHCTDSTYRYKVQILYSACTEQVDKYRRINCSTSVPHAYKKCMYVRTLSNQVLF